MSNFLLSWYAVAVALALVAAFAPQRSILFVKFVLTALAIVGVLTLPYAWESYKGMPSEEELVRGRVKAIDIVNPGVDTNGHIFVWMYPDRSGDVHTWWTDLVYGTPEPAPMNYSLPYTKDNAKQFGKAQRSIRDDGIVTISRHRKGGQDGEGEGQDGEGNGHKGKGNSNNGKGNSKDGTGSDKNSGDGDSEDNNDYQFHIINPEDLLKKDD